MEQPLIERRKYMRFDAKIKIKFQVEEEVDVPSRKISAVNKNICVEGICFISERQLEERTTLKLEIFLPFELKPLLFKGEVKWSRFLMRQKGRDLFEIGVKLSTLNKKHEDRFVDYVAQRGLIHTRKRFAG